MTFYIGMYAPKSKAGITQIEAYPFAPIPLKALPDNWDDNIQPIGLSVQLLFSL